VPILCGSLRGEEAGARLEDDPFLAGLRELLSERGDRALAVAAADLAHVGVRFGDAEPLTPSQLELLERRDRETLHTVVAGDAAAFRDAVLEAGDPRRICGLAPVTGLLSVLGPVRGKVLRYEQADDPTGTVSYAAIGLWG
jgi:AmmeMemoRadiSam system protein B